MGIPIFLNFLEVVYQVNVFKFMDASFPGVCGDEAFHLHAIILCTTIARTPIA